MATYYVKGNGNDSANGLTLATAFKTLQKAVTVANTGDKILVDGANGNILINSENECVDVTKNNLTIEGINGMPKIDGQNTWPTPNKNIGAGDGSSPYTIKALIRVNANNVTLKNLEVINSLGSGISYNTVANQTLTGGTVSNVKVHNIGWQPMSMNFLTNGVIEDSEFYHGGMYCQFSRSASVHNWPQCVQIDGCYDTVGRRLLVHEHWGEGISIPGGERNSFEDCIVYDTYSALMYINLTANNVFRRNFLYVSSDPTFYRNGSQPRLLTFNNEENDKQKDRPVTSNILVENCVVVGGGNNFEFGDQKIKQSFTNITIRNCTFIESREDGAPTNTAALELASTTYTNIKVYNCVFYQTQGSWVRGGNNLTNQFDFKNNAFFGMSTASLPTIMRGTGAILTNPQLVNPIIPPTPGSGNLNNYKIASGSSPLVNGSNTAEVPVNDILGATRVGVADVGALEFGGSVSSVTANFTGTPLTGDAPLTVNFTNTSTNATSYVWSIDSGSGFTQFSSLNSPYYTFNTPGTYSVRLVATGPGGSDTLTRTGYVVVNSAETGCVNNQITKIYTINNGTDDRTTNGGVLIDNDVVSRVGDKIATNYDNVSSLTFRNIDVAKGETAITANLALYVIGLDGPSASIKIRGEKIANSNPPTTLADFNAKDKTTATVVWNTGALTAGSTATSPNLAPIFTEIFSQSTWQPGNSITLFLEDAQGVGFQTAGMLRFATVEGGGPNPKLTLTASCGTLQSSFTISPTSPETNQTVSFTNTSVGEVASYVWNFGDGSSSNIQNPTHIYQTQGTYFVSLTVTNSLGQSSQSVQQITVAQAGTGVGTITASFTANKTNVLVGELVEFTDTSTSINGITSYLWDFGDGTFSTLQNAKHSFYHAGTYAAKLTVVGPDGTSTSTSLTIGVTNHVAQAIDSTLQLVFYDPVAKCYVHMDGAPNINYVLTLTPSGYAWVPMPN